MKNRIPGARQSLDPKIDVYGNELSQNTTGLNKLSPLKPSDSKTNDVIGEVNRLHNVDKKNTDLQVTPTPVGKKVTVNKQDVKLTDKQRYDLQKQVGQKTQEVWDAVIKSDRYKAMDDIDKAKELNGKRQDATEFATRDYVVKNNLGTYNESPGKGAQAVGIGNYDYGNGKNASIAPGIDKHSSKVLAEYNGLDKEQIKKKAYSEPDYDYKVAQAKYDNDIANGSLSKAQQINRKTELDKAKIGSKFTRDTRDLYGLSKEEAYNLITTDPKGRKIADDLLAYGDALAAATGTKNKFRTKAGAESFAEAVKGGGKGNGGSMTALRNLIQKDRISSRKTNGGVKAVALKRNKIAVSKAGKARKA
jgi:hypothetical protein